MRNGDIRYAIDGNEFEVPWVLLMALYGPIPQPSEVEL